MDPLKDLAGVADLIEEAFATDLDSSGQSALRELRWLARLKPLLWWMVTFNPEHSDFLSGFVWDEDGKVVGNITVNQTSPGGRRWLISNVAVSKNYRGRGIARGMMYAALELVKELDGVSVSLQVRADNVTARHLYDTLGFKAIAAHTFLRLKRVPAATEALFPQGITFRPRRPGVAETRQAHQLACATVSTAVQKEWPIGHSRFRLGLAEQLNKLLNVLLGGPASAYWVVEEGARFVGMLNITAGLMGQRHGLELYVHPDWRGQLETPLISRALNYLYPWRKRGVRVKHSADHPEAVEAFKALGFEEEQTLVWMKLEI